MTEWVPHTVRYAGQRHDSHPDGMKQGSLRFHQATQKCNLKFLNFFNGCTSIMWKFPRHSYVATAMPDP